MTDTIRPEHWIPTKNELEDLVKWFALKWGDQNPEFPESDPVTGQLLPGNIELSNTWYAVVRDGTKCPVCRGSKYSGVHEVQRDVVELTICANCDGQGFIKF